MATAVTVTGASVSWTLRFTDDLAAIAGRFPTGTRLTSLRLETATRLVIAGTNPRFCYGTQCGGVGGDWASGAGYTVGD